MEQHNLCKRNDKSNYKNHVNIHDIHIHDQKHKETEQ